ncbi:hypothetical protein AAHA48_21775 [Dickeya oryzae]|uniref:hypothetical protein n=1 Tax=Dickeya oryzae TaxID=1240404 RepID=UPI0031675B5F
MQDVSAALSRLAAKPPSAAQQAVYAGNAVVYFVTSCRMCIARVDKPGEYHNSLNTITRC